MSHVPLSPAESEVQEEALKFARANKKKFVAKLADIDRFVPEKHPVSVFMAGSPGAGKTEASLELLEQFGSQEIIRIDPDEIRKLFPRYNGANSYLFQGAVSIIVSGALDKIFSQDQSFILDGTFSQHKQAKENIERSIKRGRVAQILYVYQDPVQAWRFVQDREHAEGRRISLETFVSQYYAAREVVNKLKREYGKAVKVDLLMKNIDNSHRWFRAGVDQIDNHIPEKYELGELTQLLKNVKG